jgi:hypothetical protein
MPDHAANVDPSMNAVTRTRKCSLNEYYAIVLKGFAAENASCDDLPIAVQHAVSQSIFES